MVRFSLVPRNVKFDTLLMSAGDIASRTAVALQEMLADYPRSGHLVTRIKELEHEGDRVLREIVGELRETFVTPMDREDIYDLAKIIDDVVDHIDESASMLEIYQVEAVTDYVKAQADLLVEATQELSAALQHLHQPQYMEGHWVRIHQLEDEGDTVLRNGIKDVFASCYNEPAIIICWKDIYTQLEEAIDACEKAATVLEAVGVKNS